MVMYPWLGFLINKQKVYQTVPRCHLITMSTDRIPIDTCIEEYHSWIMYIYRLPMAERVGCGTPCLLGSLGVREVVGSRPNRGNSKESFSSYQETGKVFSPEMPSPWGSVSYRPSASPSYEASSHVKNYAYSGKLLLHTCISVDMSPICLSN